MICQKKSLPKRLVVSYPFPHHSPQNLNKLCLYYHNKRTQSQASPCCLAVAGEEISQRMTVGHGWPNQTSYGSKFNHESSFNSTRRWDRAQIQWAMESIMLSTTLQEKAQVEKATNYIYIYIYIHICYYCIGESDVEDLGEDS